jgi:hypothetical protein
MKLLTDQYNEAASTVYVPLRKWHAQEMSIDANRYQDVLALVLWLGVSEGPLTLDPVVVSLLSPPPPPAQELHLSGD